jgi:hypothetical protein
MGYQVRITFGGRADDAGITAAEAITLADHRAKAKGLPARCPDCGASWEYQTATVLGQNHEWTVYFRCPAGHQ